MIESYKTQLFWKLLVALPVSILLVFFIWQTSEDEASPKIIFADFNNIDMVEHGREIYFKNCSTCHGEKLEGQENWESPLADGTMLAPPHNANGHTWHHPDSLSFEMIKYGGEKFATDGLKSNMPAFSHILSDADIMATLAFIKSTWPEVLQLYNINVCRGDNDL